MSVIDYCSNLLKHATRDIDNEALSSGEPKPIISNVARGQYWKLLAEGHHLIYSL